MERPATRDACGAFFLLWKNFEPSLHSNSLSHWREQHLPLRGVTSPAGLQRPAATAVGAGDRVERNRNRAGTRIHLDHPVTGFHFLPHFLWLFKGCPSGRCGATSIRPATDIYIPYYPK
jgi:hypothetical protein